MDIRKKLVELFDEAARICNNQDCRACGYFREANCINKTIIDHLIANGVTVQEVLCDNCSNFISVDDWNFCPYCGKWLPQPPKGE